MDFIFLQDFYQVIIIIIIFIFSLGKENVGLSSPSLLFNSLQPFFIFILTYLLSFLTPPQSLSSNY